MASALMNMMMDEEKKAQAPARPASPAKPVGQPQGTELPQMPPTPAPGTPAQVGNAGQGAPQQEAAPAQPAPEDAMALLALGQGPVNPARAPRGRAMPPRGRAMPPRASTPPAPVSIPPVATGSYVDPSIVAGTGGSVDIPEGLAPADYRSAVLSQSSDANVPLENERPMPSTRTQRLGFNKNVTSTPVRQSDFEPKYDLMQGYEASDQQAPSKAASLLKEFNPVDPIFADQTDTQSNQTREIAMRVISAATGKFAGVNPLAPLKQVYTSLTREIQALRNQQNALVRGDVNAVMETLPLIQNDPIAQALRGTSGATMDQVREELKSQGKNLKGVSQYVKDQYDQLTLQIDNIINSTGFKALQHTISLAENSSGSAKQRVARGGLGFMLGIRADEGSSQQAQAQRYFGNQRLAAVGIPTVDKADIDFEDLLGQTPGFEKYFKRGVAGDIAKKYDQIQVRDAYAAELVKTSGAAVLKDFQSGKNLAPALSAKNILVMDFLKPALMDGDWDTSIKPPWVRHMQRNIASLIPIADENIGKVIDMAPSPARDALLKTAAGSYSGKSFINNLFDFNYKGREGEFVAASNIVNQRMGANDPEGAARALAPYASDDQLRLIFGPEYTTDLGIYGEQPSTFKDPYTAPIYEMTGFGGARRQRIEAYRARQIKTLYAEKRRSESNSGLGSGRPVIAGLAGMYGIPPALLGLPVGAEDVKSTYNAFVNSPEDLKMSELTRYTEDIVHFITPNVDDKMHYVPDDSWDESVRTLDVAIYELQKNIDSGVVASDKLGNAKILLSSLTDARDQVRAELESGIEVGTNRGVLFRNKGGEIDYGQPIKALTGQGRTAQAIDMIGAWVSGKPGVDINKYFSATNRTVVTGGSKIVGFAEDVDGNPIQTKPIYGSEKGDVKTPVLERKDGKWVPVLDVAGRPVVRRKPIDARVLSTTSALLSANTDTTSVGVDDNYVRLQINGFARDIMGLIKDAPDMDERGSSFSEITGIPVDESGRFTFADFQKYLTRMNPYKGKQLLGWLNTYSSNAATAPSPRVTWAMNATNSRGRVRGVDERAVENVERDEVTNVKGLIYRDFDTTWHGVTATARNVVNELEARNEILDAEADLEPTKRLVTRQVLKHFPYVDESTPEGQITLRNLDQWIDAYIRDDMETQVAVHKQARANIATYASEVAPDMAEENIRGNIRRGNAATITPEEKQARDDAERQRRLEANKTKSQAEAAERARTQSTYYTAYIPKKGWVTFNGTAEEIRKVRSAVDSKQFDSDAITSDAVTRKSATARDIEIARRSDTIKKVPGGTPIRRNPRTTTDSRRGQLSPELPLRLEPRRPTPPPAAPEAPTPVPPAPKPRSNKAAAAKRIGGAGMGVLGFYGLTQRRGGN